MSRITQLVDRFVSLVESGEPLEAMEQFYDDEVLVFENRELARAGKQRCLEFEREQLGRATSAPRFKALKRACNESEGVSFIEWLIRYDAEGDRPMRLEEVAVQTWQDDRIVKERFYYEGVIDEGE